MCKSTEYSPYMFLLLPLLTMLFIVPNVVKTRTVSAGLLGPSISEPAKVLQSPEFILNPEGTSSLIEDNAHAVTDEAFRVLAMLSHQGFDTRTGRNTLTARITSTSICKNKSSKKVTWPAIARKVALGYCSWIIPVLKNWLACLLATEYLESLRAYYVAIAFT